MLWPGLGALVGTQLLTELPLVKGWYKRSPPFQRLSKSLLPYRHLGRGSAAELMRHSSHFSGAPKMQSK